MIPVLYEPNETNFDTNGVGLLTDAISCEVEEERNGAFELVLKYPQEGNISEYIKEDCIIKAKPNDVDEDQLFRIYKSGKPIAGNNTWYAEHISYSLNTNPVNKPKITGKNAQEAITQLLEDAVIENNFTAWSDITTRNSTEIDDVISVRKALGGVEGSILDTWGGEYRFNNFCIELHKSRGSDKGIEIRYGKNMLDANQEKNIADVVTAIFPYAYYKPDREEGQEDDPEEIFVSLPEKTISTPNAQKYATVRCVPVDFSDQFEDGVITETMLRKVAAEYVQSGIDEPKVSIKTSFVNLWQTKEYANIKALEAVGLCDTVTVIIERLGISVKAKITSYKYNVLKERFESVEIGEAKTNLTKEITKNQQESQQQIIKTATRSEILKKQIEKTIIDVTAAITGNSGGHVVLHPAENPQEIFVMDTDDTATAKNVWRWNLAGLGHSSSGIGGPFTTAITADGQIVADFITAGKLSGLLLEAGTVKAESIDAEYKQSVLKYADDGKKAVLKEMESRFQTTAESIEAEVKRATGAEKTISDDIAAAEKTISDFEKEVTGAFRDGVITEAECYAIEKYLNEIKKDNETIEKQYTAVLNSLRTDSSSGSNLSIKFNAACATEISSAGTKYDYLQLYYVKNGTVYRALEKASGADIAGQTYIVPATEIYVYWYSDGSGHNFYGFSIDELKRTTAAATLTSETVGIIPTAVMVDAATKDIICTSHPYGDGERKLWHFKADNTTKAFLTTKKNQYTTAYNALVTAIQNAIADKEATETEKNNVNTKFTAYNTALAAFKEAIQSSGADIAARAAAGAVEYAAANFKVTADQITAEVTRATNAEETLQASIKVNADAIKLKVSSGDVTSLIEQKADSIRLKANKIAWSSTYSSMTSSGILTCQNANINGTLKSVNGNNIVEMRSGRFRITYNGQEIGMIGGNGFAGYSDKEGLNFDLEYTGDYMTWAAQPSSGSNYDVKWTYARSSFGNLTGGKLNAGCDIDMHNWTLRNVYFEGGGIDGTMNFVQIKSMASDGTVNTWTNGCKMQFKNGILISGTWN